MASLFQRTDPTHRDRWGFPTERKHRKTHLIPGGVSGTGTRPGIVRGPRLEWAEHAGTWSPLWGSRRGGKGVAHYNSRDALRTSPSPRRRWDVRGGPRRAGTTAPLVPRAPPPPPWSGAWRSGSAARWARSASRRTPSR